jgi:hypothetical protein
LAGAELPDIGDVHDDIGWLDRQPVAPDVDDQVVLAIDNNRLEFEGQTTLQAWTSTTLGRRT